MRLELTNEQQLLDDYYTIKETSNKQLNQYIGHLFLQYLLILHPNPQQTKLLARGDETLSPLGYLLRAPLSRARYCHFVGKPLLSLLGNYISYLNSFSQFLYCAFASGHALSVNSFLTVSSPLLVLVLDIQTLHGLLCRSSS